ncbi:MAG TPA: DUF3089 domain-containing protein, partial [Solirubrobacterales bacterium]
MTNRPLHATGAVRVRLALAAVVLAALAALAMLAPASSPAKTKWVCKPGSKPNPCKGSLETTRYAVDGSSRIETPRNARKPRFDCFYVYPTVSEQGTENANKHIDPQQTAIAQYQAARFSEDCRVFAPVYRQLTLKAIGGSGLSPDAVEIAYGDVLEAWKTYLRRYNHGRGVVLIGHSQGTFHLRELLADEIEDKAAERK